VAWVRKWKLSAPFSGGVIVKRGKEEGAVVILLSVSSKALYDEALAFDPIILRVGEG